MVGRVSVPPNFSVKEKDEASLSHGRGRTAECLHSPSCRGLKALFSDLALVSGNQSALRAETKKDQRLCLSFKTRYLPKTYRY